MYDLRPINFFPFFGIDLDTILNSEVKIPDSELIFDRHTIGIMERQHHENESFMIYGSWPQKIFYAIKDLIAPEIIRFD